MREEFSRTEMLLGAEAMERLAGAKVAVFGIGGVGGHAARHWSGAGLVPLFLWTTIRCPCQISTVRLSLPTERWGQYKVDVMRARALEINPRVRVEARRCFFLPENEKEFDFSQYQYVVDAVDNVTAKLLIIRRSREAGVPVISAMGAGNKLHPELFRL